MSGVQQPRPHVVGPHGIGHESADVAALGDRAVDGAALRCAEGVLVDLFPRLKSWDSHAAHAALGVLACASTPACTGVAPGPGVGASAWARARILRAALRSA